jgi:hypothetical protein
MAVDACRRARLVRQWESEEERPRTGDASLVAEAGLGSGPEAGYLVQLLSSGSGPGGAAAGGMGAEVMLDLQRLAGNRAVRGLAGSDVPFGAKQLIVQRSGEPTGDEEAADRPWWSHSRRLTDAEKEAARSVFGGALDTDKVELSLGTIISAGGYARTVYNTIYFPGDALTGDYVPWLIHELTHVWQYQRGADLPGMMWEAIVGKYDYGGQDGLRQAWGHGQAFDEFTTEQQGDILEDYYRALRAHRDTAAFDGFVEQVRTGNEKVHRYRPVEPLAAGTFDWVKANRDFAAKTEAKIVHELKRQIAADDVAALATRKQRLLWHFYDLSGYLGGTYEERIRQRRSDDEMVRLLFDRISTPLRAELVEALRGRRPSGDRPRA